MTPSGREVAERLERLARPSHLRVEATCGASRCVVSLFARIGDKEFGVAPGSLAVEGGELTLDGRPVALSVVARVVRGVDEAVRAFLAASSIVREKAAEVFAQYTVGADYTKSGWNLLDRIIENTLRVEMSGASLLLKTQLMLSLEWGEEGDVLVLERAVLLGADVIRSLTPEEADLVHQLLLDLAEIFGSRELERMVRRGRIYWSPQPRAFTVELWGRTTRYKAAPPKK